MGDPRGRGGVLFRAVAGRIVERYGVEPEIEYFTVFCITDNATGEVRVVEPAEEAEAA